MLLLLCSRWLGLSRSSLGLGPFVIYRFCLDAHNVVAQRAILPNELGVKVSSWMNAKNIMWVMNQRLRKQLQTCCDQSGASYLSTSCSFPKRESHIDTTAVESSCIESVERTWEWWFPKSSFGNELESLVRLEAKTQCCQNDAGRGRCIRTATKLKNQILPISLICGLILFLLLLFLLLQRFGFLN